jgi:signal transduction histidine kinase
MRADGADDIQNLRTELEKREKELAAVFKISAALSSKIEVDDLVREALEASLDAVNARGGTIYLYDEQKQKLVFRYVVNPDAPDVAKKLTGMEINPDQGIAGQVFQSGQSSIDDDPMQHKGHLREVGERVGFITRNMVTVPLISMGGNPIGVMQVLNKDGGNFDDDDRDLLTIMAAQAATALDNARLYQEAKAATIMHYLGDISHDIKNLMTPAQTGTQTLEMILRSTFEDLDSVVENSQDGAAVAAQVQHACQTLRSLYPEMIEMVIDSTTATQERVREIADAVKGEIAEPFFELFNVNDVVLSVVKALKVVAERHGVTLRTDELGDVPPILIDKKRLYNAIYNLVNNAWPETPEGGYVTVRTRAVPEGTFPDGNYLIIEIADTGRGMPDEIKQRLFTEHVQSTKPGGTGLGTQIVKRVVDAHDGVIWVESELGKGTTFFIKLPFKTQ